MSYIPKVQDQNFLAAVEEVLQTHKEAGVKPNSESALSRLISKDRNLIYKVKNGKCGVPSTALEEFCSVFGFDLEAFEIPSATIQYDLSAYDPLEHYGTQGVYVGTATKSFVTQGEVHNPTVMDENHGTIFQGGIHNHVVHRIMEGLNPEDRDKLDTEFRRLYERIGHLEKQLEIQTAHIKKMTEDHNAQIERMISLHETTQTAQMEATARERDWADRYMKLVDKE